MSVLDAIVLCGAAVAIARGIHLLVVLRSIPRLADLVAADDPRSPPSVTIAVAARDEAEHLAAAARSWLAQDAPLEIVAVDDRSVDATSAILAEIAATDERLRPLRVERRPDGWLGKCHALKLASDAAAGDFILFTDADVRLEPSALRRALLHAVDEDADVVTLMPEVECEGAVQRALTGTFFHFFLSAMGGRGANRDDGRCVVGVGAFNLVRRSAYEAAGGHEPLRMQVGDDIGLVRLLQRHGGRHRLADGDGLVRLRWQAGVLGTIRGLEKNFFWGARLSLLLVLAFTAGTALLLSPLLAPLGGPAAWAGMAAWLLALAAPERLGGPREGWLLRTLLHPVSALLLVVAAWNSALRTLHRGGISWRGDVFPLAELRAALLPWRWWREPIRSRPRDLPPESGSSRGA